MFEKKDLTDNDTQIVSSEAKEESKDSTRKGLTSSASPEVLLSQEEQTPIQECPPDMPSPKPHEEEKHWYVLRATYGRELKAKEYLDDHDIKTFLPLQKVVKRVDKRLRKSEEPMLKNIFFALGTDSSLKEYVYDNVHLPYLRFYYERFSNPDGSLSKRPLIIPDYQMESFKRIYESKEADKNFENGVIAKFQTGDLVRVIAGPFEGVIGRVARYKGQQRVGLVIDKFLTVTTSYVPKSDLEPLNDQEYT